MTKNRKSTDQIYQHLNALPKREQFSPKPESDEDELDDEEYIKLQDTGLMASKLTQNGASKGSFVFNFRTHEITRLCNQQNSEFIFWSSSLFFKFS
jgi:hypothetical protein